MKKYTSQATRIFAIAASIFGVVLLIGVASAFLDVENIGVPIGLISSGGLFGVLFLTCFFAEKTGR